MTQVGRFDAAIARLTVSMGQMWGAKRLKMSDFMPWPKRDPEPASPQEVLAFLSKAVRRTND